MTDWDKVSYYNKRIAELKSQKVKIEFGTSLLQAFEHNRIIDRDIKDLQRRVRQELSAWQE